MKRSTVFTAVLSLLGFPSCDIVGTTEYGCPHADFGVKGVVTDTENRPLEGIEVSVEMESGYETSVSAVSDRQGMYTVRMEVFPKDDKVQVKAEDTDGELNGGRFAADSVVFELSRSDFKGGSGMWYEGKAVRDVDFKLEEEK